MISTSKTAYLVTLLGLCAASGCAKTPASGFTDPETDLDAGTTAGDGGPVFTPSTGCADGKKTTLSGTVYDPAGNVPLYNAIVYVPTKPLDPFSTGASCEGRCGVPVSGAPQSSGLSGSDGKFQLEVTPGDNVPLVVQIGKWRRQTTIPKVERCTDTRVTDHDLTRLPRNAKEGSLPQMAIETGQYDALECMLLRLGVDASEFTAPSGSGRVHMYQASSGATLDGGAGVQGKDLWSSLDRLKTYDMTFFECAGTDYPQVMTAADRDTLVAYADLGGRVFTTDYAGLAWIKQGAGAFPGTAAWKSGAGAGTFAADVETGFPKGKAFGEWLYAVHATTTNGGRMSLRSEIMIVPQVASAVAPSQQWLYLDSSKAPMQYTFNTPVGKPAAEQCGRVAFNDFHVADTSGDYPSGERSFPGGCKSGALTAQELALAFLVFDLASCIQDDLKTPELPK